LIVFSFFFCCWYICWYHFLHYYEYFFLNKEFRISWLFSLNKIWLSACILVFEFACLDCPYNLFTVIQFCFPQDRYSSDTHAFSFQKLNFCFKIFNLLSIPRRSTFFSLLNQLNQPEFDFHNWYQVGNNGCYQLFFPQLIFVSRQKLCMYGYTISLH